VYADRALDVPAASKGWHAVSTGSAHTCGIRVDGALYCWGNDASSQLGVVARGQCGRVRNACEGGPRAVAPSMRFQAVSAGSRHTCAISTARALYCWGESYRFQTGVQALPIVATPTAVMPDLQFLDVGAGVSHSCAVRTNGVVYCWGDGTLGALGRGDTITNVIPAAIATSERFVMVRSGQQRSCAIALDGAAWCWGAEWESAQGNIDYYHARLIPHRIDGLPPLRDISVGVTSICAVAQAGEVYCWEANGFAQLGSGTLVPTAIPSPVASDVRFTTVSVGIIQSCATAADGRAMCWGNNSFGQLGVPRPGDYCGDSALECSRVPIAVFGKQHFTAVATGIGNHACGVSVDTSVLCWGLGADGQLGDGYTRDRQSLPVGVLSPAP
jgi:alpha-tubulin suppressor-like RCC1 family protein